MNAEKNATFFVKRCFTKNLTTFVKKSFRTFLMAIYLILISSGAFAPSRSPAARVSSLAAWISIASDALYVRS